MKRNISEIRSSVLLVPLVMNNVFTFFACSLILLLSSCTVKKKMATDDHRIPIIFDTDANNELDDQHAMAYLLFNRETFNVLGITVNATYNGGDIQQQYDEAKRVMELTKSFGKIPLIKGANKSFAAILPTIGEANYDGNEAVNFIIKEARKNPGQKLVVLAVGKLTTVALALEKDPEIAQQIRLVWLGSNYPDPGEYNQDNDTVAMNYILNKNVPFEMVTVRYGKASGTAAVTATKNEVMQKMPGLGPEIDTPVEGRHGGLFSTFGDYSVNLFQHIHFHDEMQSRALFDMAAVSILKQPEWAQRKEIPAPILIDNQWVERPENKRKILLWENFDKENIMNDFYSVMKNPSLVDE